MHVICIIDFVLLFIFLFIMFCFSDHDSSVSNSSEDDSDPDTERRKDLKERDDFAKRLRDKDKEKTHNVASKSDKKVCHYCSYEVYFKIILWD